LDLIVVLTFLIGGCVLATGIALHLGRGSQIPPVALGCMASFAWIFLIAPPVLMILIVLLY
jgi:hypothetical protein